MQNDPLKPGYDFNAHLVAGLTPISKGNDLDFVIDRPHGMKGFIINLTVKVRAPYFTVMTPLRLMKAIYYSFQRVYHTTTTAQKRLKTGIIAGSIFALAPTG